MIAPAYDDGYTLLFCADAREAVARMPGGSVDCVVTSPPYWRKRDYGIEGQYGLETDFTAYVDRLRGVFAEVYRVLSDEGSLWLNLGDSYCTTAAGPRTNTGTLQGPGNARAYPAGFGTKTGLPLKNLVGIPWRVALALQLDGWILRSDIIWHKPNAMPENVTDRPTGRYEHLFLLAKQRSYYFDGEPLRDGTAAPDPRTAASEEAADSSSPPESGLNAATNRSGRKPGDVWTIATRPSPAGHYAGFPLEVPLRAIAAGCPEGGTVLDPFCGTGTTLVAARQHRRRAIGIDLQPAYCAIAVDRLSREVAP